MMSFLRNVRNADKYDHKNQRYCFQMKCLYHAVRHNNQPYRVLSSIDL